jgi:preprotein translocase subunit SecD
MAQSSKTWILGIVAIVLLCLLCIGGTGAALGYLTLRPKTMASDGGVELVLRTEAEARDATLEVVHRRIDEMGGTRGATVVAQGDDQIVVQVPGTMDSQALTAVLSRGGYLQFLPVSAEATPLDRPQQGDLELHWSFRFDDATGSRVRDQAYTLRPDARLTGEMIADASVAIDQFNSPYVALEFNEQGAEAFCSLTGDLTGSELAIVLDGEVLSAPRVMEPICGGRAQITLGSGGSADRLLREAQDLALTLRAGALPAPVTIESVSVVGPAG